MACQRRNRQALPAAGIEFPAVVTALKILPVKVAVGEGYPAVRAGITHRECLAFARASEHQWHFQEHRGRQIAPADSSTGNRRVPKIPQKPGVRLWRSVPPNL